MGIHHGWHQGAYLREARRSPGVFLRVIVARNPPRRVVAVHAELRLLLLDGEVSEVLLPWELITQSHAVVIDPEAQHHRALCRGLREGHLQLVVVVTDGRLLTPDGCPCLVEGAVGGLTDNKAVHKVCAAFGQLHAERGGQHHGFAAEVNAIGGYAAVG